ncbi:MAG: OmpA family protein [Myxococcales bacterium]|nr:OmpA family protein [Myxococcales bacterium]
MSDESRPVVTTAEREAIPTSGGDELQKLRHLLLGKEQSQIGRLEEEVDKCRPTAENLASVLPKAIDRATALDDQRLTDSLAPTVEKAIQISVKKDATPLVNALFPVMGPAIRKAIAETFSGMIQSLNLALEKSFSVQGLKWRLEAWRTGKPFGEVVLLHGLVFRVERIFLIHQKTGVLLWHAADDAAQSQDGDMVSGMLTAIQDFVHDSFAVRQGDKLETIQVGELKVWIVQGPAAFLAAVIRGDAPESYHEVLHEILEQVHRERGRELAEFTGDTEPFAAIEPELRRGLRAQYKEKEHSLRRAYLALGAVLVALLLWTGFLTRDNLRWADYLARLGSEPGLVVVESGHRFGRYWVNGLRDPLAADPAFLLSTVKLNPKKVSSRWQPFQSLDDKLLLNRARAVLLPPEKVSLRLENGTLFLSGVAPHSWIVAARERARGIAGIVALDTKTLLDEDGDRLQALKARVEKAELWFQVNSTQLLPDQIDKLDSLAADIREIDATATRTGQTARFRLIGRADSRGTEAVNAQLSQRRAEAVGRILFSKGLRTDIFSVDGLGANKPLESEDTENGRVRNRSVVVEVVITGIVP